MNRLLSILAGVLIMLPLLSSCGGAKLTTANEQMERGEYYDAYKTYKKVYDKLTKREERPLKGEVAFKMAECYTKLSMNSNASAAYQNAIKFGYPDSTAILKLACSQQAEGKYALALKSFEEYLNLVPDDKTALNGAAGCRMAIAAKDSPTRYVVKSNKVFNSRRADFSPMFFDSALDQIYYTTTNEKVTGDHRSEITGMKKGDIWMSRKNEKGEWMKPEPVEGELNSDMDEGIISFSPDGSTMYLTKARRSPNSNTGVEIYTSTRSDAKWSAPVKLDITADTLSSYGHPAVSTHGEWL